MTSQNSSTPLLTLRAQKEGEQKKVFTHTFGSPFQVEWPNPPRPLQLEIQTLLTKITSTSPKPPSLTFGFKQTQKVLQKWIESCDTSIAPKNLIVFMVKPNPLSPDLLSWLPSLVHFANMCHPVFLVTLVSNKKWAKTSSMTLEVSTMCQNPDLKQLLNLASQFPQPKIPFYEYLGGFNFYGKLQFNWKAKYLPLNIKTLQTKISPPRFKRQKSKENKAEK